MFKEKLRLARLFFAVDRLQELHTLAGMVIHFNNYGRLGEQNEKMLNDMESRYMLQLQRYDNHFDDLIIEAKNQVIADLEVAKVEKEQEVVKSPAKKGSK